MQLYFYAYLQRLRDSVTVKIFLLHSPKVQPKQPQPLPLSNAWPLCRRVCESEDAHNFGDIISFHGVCEATALQQTNVGLRLSCQGRPRFSS